MKPCKVQCKVCKDVIWSRYEGEFVSCRCKAISVDQTEHYMRRIGAPENFLEVKDEDSVTTPNT